MSERKNATQYHAIEYQLSKKFLFLKRCLHYALFQCVILVRWFLYKKASASSNYLAARDVSQLSITLTLSFTEGMNSEVL